MNGNGHDERLQDYLDDRMTPDERRAFEDVLARDPDLAAAVDDARALGASLRALDAPLPDGFHDRVRERFEASVSPRRRFPWEGLGLAAAALVIGAILVPWAMRTEFGETEPVVTEQRERPGVARTAPSASGPGDPKLEQVVADAVSERDEPKEREPSTDFAPAPTGPKETRERKAAVPPPEVASSNERDVGAIEGFADVAEDEDAGGRVDRAPESLRKSAAIDAPRAQRVAAPLGRAAAAEPVAAPLTAEQFDDSGATATAAGRVPNAETWSRWVAGPGGAALAALAPDGDWASIAVIAGPADCDRVRVVPDRPGGVAVYVPDGPHAGCAIGLRDPAAPVRIVREPTP